MLYKIHSFTKAKRCHFSWSALPGIYYIVSRWGEMSCSAPDAVSVAGLRWNSPWACPGAVPEHSAALLRDVWESGWAASRWKRSSQELLPLAVVRALKLPWERCEILHGDKYLIIWGLHGKIAAPATQCPRLLNCSRRWVIIERGRCFLINYVNPAAAQPNCVFSNIIWFCAQLLSVLWATANLKKLQFYSVVALDLGQTIL